MNTLFAAQPVGSVSPFDGFTANTTPEQNAQSYGKALDQGFKRYCIVEPRAAPSLTIPKFFNPRAITYIRAPQREQEAIDVRDTAIGAFEVNNRALSSEENAARLLALNGGYGKYSARNTLAIVKAALAIATRATEAQMAREKVDLPVSKAGVLGATIPSYGGTPNGSEKIIGALGKFMEPFELRETLFTFNQAEEGAALRDPVMGDLVMDEINPGNNLASEAAYIQDAGERRRFVKERVAKAIRYQRIAPHYSNIGSTPMGLVRKTAEQFKRSMNGFKPRPNDRFFGTIRSALDG